MATNKLEDWNSKQRVTHFCPQLVARLSPAIETAVRLSHMHFLRKYDGHTI